MTVDELIQSPRSLTKGCVFYAERNGFIAKYTAVGFTATGIIAEDRNLRFFLLYSDLNSDPSFTIESRPKKKFRLW